MTEDELELAQSLIDRLAPGEYEVEQIFGEFWDTIASPTSYGRAFKKAVTTGQLQRIEWLRRSATNHQIYLVSSGSSPPV